MKRSDTLKRGTFKHIEDILRDYPRIDSYLKQREEELLYPTKEQDDNIGGGKSSEIGKPTEQKGITLAEDMRLRELRKQKDAIERTLNKADFLTCRVIESYYMCKQPKTWESVSFEVSSGQISSRTLRRMRTEFFKNLAVELGW